MEAPEVEQEVLSKRADVSIKKFFDRRGGLRALPGKAVSFSQTGDRKGQADVQIATRPGALTRCAYQ